MTAKQSTARFPRMVSMSSTSRPTRDNQSLWLRQVAAASNVQIVPPSNVQYGGMTFSGDGNFIYYMSSKDNAGELYRMPVLGGAPQRLIFDIDSLIALSPDGKRLAFLRGYPADDQGALMIANADGTSEQKLAIRKNPDFSLPRTMPGLVARWKSYRLPRRHNWK